MENVDPAVYCAQENYIKFFVSDLKIFNRE